MTDYCHFKNIHNSHVPESACYLNTYKEQAEMLYSTVSSIRHQNFPTLYPEPKTVVPHYLCVFGISHFGDKICGRLQGHLPLFQVGILT